MDERQSAILAGLQEMSALIKTDTPFGELLDSLVGQVREAVAADVVIVRAYNELDGYLSVQAVKGVSVEQTAGLVGGVTTASKAFVSLRPGSVVAYSLGDDAITPVLGPAEIQEARELGCLHALALPLYHRGRLLGRLDLFRVRNEPFSLFERGAANLLATLVTGAVYELPREEPPSAPPARESDVIKASFQFQQSIEPLADVGEMLQSVVESAREIVHADRCYGLLWHQGWEEFTPVAASGADAELVETLKGLDLSPRSVPVLGEVLEHEGPIHIEEKERVDRLSLNMVVALDVRSAVVVPLRGRQRSVLGALLFDATDPKRTFSRHDLEILAAIGPRAAMMVENALLYEQVRRSSDSLALVNEIGLDLASLADPSSLFIQVYEHVRSVLDASRFCIGLLIPGENRVEYHYAVNNELSATPAVAPLGDDPLSQVIRTRESVLRLSREPSDLSDWFPPLPEIAPSESMIAVPIMVGRRAIGVMCAQTEERGAYAEHQRSLLATIGMQMGVAIENARLYAMVQQRGERRGVLLDRVLSQQEVERKSLVDDIHNDTLQTLASCLYQIDVTSRKIDQLDPAQVQEQLRAIRDSLAENIDRLRRIIFQIRPSTLDVLGLEPALREHFKQLERDTGLSVSLEIDIDSRPSGELETMLYRIVLEAIDNARLRSGVRKAAVKIRQRGNALVVTVADDGQHRPGAEQRREPALLAVGGGGGMSDAEMSLMTLKERAELAGGQVRMASRVSGGTTLQIVLPLRGET